MPAGAIVGRTRLPGAFTIELSRIRPDPNQPRKNLDTEAQCQLTESILQVGILLPITVRYIAEDDTYQVISGERRYHASLAAGLNEIPCLVRDPNTEDILLHQIVENWQRADLHPYELADALACLRDANGYTQKQLSKLTGKPESEISRLLSLLNLNAEAQRQTRLAAAGTFTKRHLAAIAQLPDGEQRSFVQVIQENHLTAVQTEQLVQESNRRHEGSKTRGAPLGRRLRYVTVKAVVTLSFRRRSVSTDEILAALDETRDQVKKGQVAD